MAKHVFHDGNKRTGMLACQIFLELNEYDLQIAFHTVDEEAATISEGIAKQQVNLSTFTHWITQRAKQV